MLERLDVLEQLAERALVSRGEQAPEALDPPLVVLTLRLVVRPGRALAQRPSLRIEALQVRLEVVEPFSHARLVEPLVHAPPCLAVAHLHHRTLEAALLGGGARADHHGIEEQPGAE